jgi:hypothetical protein
VHETILIGVVLISLAIVNTRGGFYFVMSVVTPRHLEPPPGADSSGSALDPGDPAPAGSAPARATTGVPTGASARVSATIGGLERLLIVAFVLAGAWIGVALLLVVKTMARFRQLDDPGFAEFYLLGTLASVSVAILSAGAALAALSTIGI